MTSEFEKGCCYNKNCCEKSCCEKSCCCVKKCKICKFVAYVVCTAFISFVVVKFTAPCVVHEAFVKKLGEHQLHKMMKYASMDPKMMHKHFEHNFEKGAKVAEKSAK